MASPLINGLFNKKSQSITHPSAGASSSSGSPLEGFLKRLFPTGDYLERLAAPTQPDGSQRASYYCKAPAQENKPPKKINKPQSPAPSASQRKREQVIAARIKADHAFEESQRSADELKASRYASAAAEARKKRIREASSASSEPRPAPKRSREERQSDLQRKQQRQTSQQQESERIEREKAARALKQQAMDAKKQAEQQAVERKKQQLREAQEAKARRNEEKRQRVQRVKLEQLEKHLEKAAKVAAKAAAREEEEENEEEGGCDWWCDVAAEGVCLRPCAGVYEPDRYYCCGAEYSVCTNCYHSVLTEDQREQLELVDP